MQLFNDSVRTDSSPIKAMESSYAFLDRSSWPVCLRARALMQSWFDRYPDNKHRRDLYRRFTSKRDEHHRSAYFELLLHEVLTRMGAKLTIEPSVPGTTKTPDFLVELDGDRFFLEAMVSHAKESEFDESPILDTVCEWIQEMEVLDYLVHISLSGTPSYMPTRASISDQITQLVRLSNHQTTRQQLFDGGYHSLASGFLEIADAYARVRLIPRAEEHVGVVGLRNVIRSSGGVMQDVAPVWRESIRRKARHKDLHLYDAPCVIVIDVLDGFARIGDKGAQAVYGVGGDSGPQSGVWNDANTVSWRDNLAAVWMFNYVEPVQASPTGIEDCLMLSSSMEQLLPTSLEQVNHIKPENGELHWRGGISLDELLDVTEIPYEELRRGPGA